MASMNRLCELSEATEISGCTTLTVPGFMRLLCAFRSFNDGLQTKYLVPTKDPGGVEDAKETDCSLTASGAGCDATRTSIQLPERCMYDEANRSSREVVL